MTTENLACTVRRLSFIRENHLGSELRCYRRRSLVYGIRVQRERAVWESWLRWHHVTPWAQPRRHPGAVQLWSGIKFLCLSIQKPFTVAKLWWPPHLSSVSVTLIRLSKDLPFKKWGPIGSAHKEESPQDFSLGYSGNQLWWSIQKGEAGWEKRAWS